MAAIAGLGQRDVAAFVKKCQNVQNTIPNAARAAASKAGMDVKTAWLGVARQRAGISPSNKIARRKWNVGYDVKGGANATALVSFRGPVHLVFSPTKGHFIGAKLLGTRSGIRSRAGKARANAATGEMHASGLYKGNRGTFGQFKIFVNYTDHGSVRQQMAKGELRKRNGKKALTINGSLRAYAFHQGTRGKTDVWPEAKRLATEIGPAAYKTEYRRALIQAGFEAGQSIAGGLTK